MTWLHRLPHSAWALVVCALALLLGVAAAQDYGVWGDTPAQRAIGEATLRHLAGENGLNLLVPPWDRLYGPIFEAPLALVERILGGDDSRSLYQGRPASRSIYLGRHLLTHLFFVTAGFVCYLLAHRLFGNRWLALFALLLFLLHPRIYAHSFFNSKDVPFLSLFMICLWLAHRAFGKGTEKGSAGAFALCGVAAGLLTNMRILGFVFVGIVFFMRVCDVVAAGGWDERRRSVASGATFALASVAAFYATMPYLWADPVVRFMEILAFFSAHPDDPLQLFQGKFVYASELPPSYLPVWFGITTPPLALLLGAVGLTALAWRTAAGLFSSSGAPTIPLRNTPLRFELLVAACFVGPLLAAIVLRPTIYDAWRHFYFLWGPFVLLAASGLRALIDGVRDAPRPWRIPTEVVAGLAALGLGAIAVETARLHPYQHLYFNKLADRTGAALPLSQRFGGIPSPLAFWAIDALIWPRGYAYILEELAERERPDAVFNVGIRKFPYANRPRSSLVRHKAVSALFRERDRRRFKFDPNADVDFYVSIRGHSPLGPPVLYERQLYGQAILQVATPDLSRADEATADAYRAHYRQVTSGAPALAGDIDVYRGETAITWVKESCPPGGVNDAQGMIAVPLDATQVRRTLYGYGVRVGDACVWQAALPNHAIAKLIFPGIGALVSDAHLEERRRRYAMLVATPPAARSVFDVRLVDDALFYVKTPCVAADAEAPFFVHVRPKHLADLPASRRRFGFDTLDFKLESSLLAKGHRGVDPLWRYAASDIFDGICQGTLDLPDYPVASVATGQYEPGGTGLWHVDIGGG